MHITDLSLGILGMNGIIGASWYIGAGAAYGAKLRGTKQVAVSYGGDGASNSVYYFSALRNAYNYKLPFVAVIENNLWQITIPMSSNVPGGHASTYTKGLPIPSVTVDGNDVAEVFAATKEAVERARAGEGPSVIEASTIRWYDHAGFAGAKVGVEGAFGLPYRQDAEVKTGMARDPISRFRQFLLDRKLFTEAELTKIETDAQAAVDASVEFARNSPKTKPEDGVLHVYAKGTVSPTQFLNGTVTTAYHPNPADLAVFGKTLPLDT
jgi:pyruvate dehydrogenase E1 component alpha subunit